MNRRWRGDKEGKMRREKGKRGERKGDRQWKGDMKRKETEPYI